MTVGERRAWSGTVVRDLSKIGVVGQGGREWQCDEPLIERLRMALSFEDAARVLRAHRFPLALAERPMRTLSPGERARMLYIRGREKPQIVVRDLKAGGETVVEAGPRALLVRARRRRRSGARADARAVQGIHRALYAALASHSAMTSRSSAWSVVLRRLASRSRARHKASEKRIDRGEEPSGRAPFTGRPRRARTRARALRSPAAPRPSTMAFETSISGISRSEARLGPLVRFLLLAFFIARSLCRGRPPGADDAEHIGFDLDTHDEQDSLGCG